MPSPANAHNNRRSPTGLLLSCILWVVVSFSIHLLGTERTNASELSCPEEHRITVEFTNGAGWMMCWTSMQRENIVLSEIHYKSATQGITKVISTLRLAQLHVTYDDGNITYNDVTQFGLGGGYVATLIPSDCPKGDLIEINGRAGICKQLTGEYDAYNTLAESRFAETLTLLSISQVGSYSYMVTWKFHDDGSIEPLVGAAGALQRSTDLAHSPHGRTLEGVADKTWLSHTHNYYWRIDFDLGDSAIDDVVSEVSYPTDQSGRRARVVRRLSSESALTIDPAKLLAWYVTSGDGEVARAPGYRIEPLHYGHKLVRSTAEPYTAFDFFVTRQNDCERFISENAKYHPECGDHILDFIDNESIVGEDIVVWHRISFHHVPRNEDRYHMHSHWDGFVMQARNLSAGTPGHSGRISNVPPELMKPADQLNKTGDTINLKITANDSDDDELSFHATGLPAGLNIDTQGTISGIPTEPGIFRVTVFLSDKVHTTATGINWQITDPDTGAGSLGLVSFNLLFLLTVYRYRRSVIAD